MKTLLHLGFVALALTLGGCLDPHADDKEEIRQVYQQLDDCNNGKNGVEVLAVFTEGSFEPYMKIMKVAMDGTPEEVKALGPSARMEVLMIRACCTRKDLAGLDGRGYVKMATSRGWYVTPPEDQVESKLSNFRFQGDHEVLVDATFDGDKSTATPLRFLRENDQWKYDEPYALAQYDRHYVQAARALGITVDEFVASEVEDRLRKELPESVKRPMPK